MWEEEEEEEEKKKKRREKKRRRKKLMSRSLFDCAVHEIFFSFLVLCFLSLSFYDSNTLLSFFCVFSKTKPQGLGLRLSNVTMNNEINEEFCFLTHHERLKSTNI